MIRQGTVLWYSLPRKKDAWEEWLVRGSLALWGTRGEPGEVAAALHKLEVFWSAA